MTHQEYYIHLLMNTLSEKEYAEEKKRNAYILGARIKPKRTEQGNAFVDYVITNIYTGNTAFDILKKHFNIKTDNATYDFWCKKLNITQEQMQVHIEASSRLAKYKIRKAFEKYDDELTKILEQ